MYRIIVYTFRRGVLKLCYSYRNLQEFAPRQESLKCYSLTHFRKS